jgi:hypothetical protein
MNNEVKISNRSYLFSKVLIKILIFFTIIFGLIIFFIRQDFIIIIVLSIVLVISFIIGCYLIWHYHGREYLKEEINYNQKYEFNLPYNDDPLLANYFVEGRISNNWFSSGILYLIWKKVYSFEKINKKDYLIKIKKSNLKLPSYVQRIYDFLEMYFVENELNLLEFQKRIEGLDYIKKGNNYNVSVYNTKPYVNQDYVNFNRLYKSVSTEYYDLFHSDQFYIKKGYLIFKKFLILFLIISTFLSFLLNTYFFLIISFIIIIYFYNLYSPTIIFGKFTKKGMLRKLKWNAFKNHIQDHSSIKTHPINHVILWDEYLIYGTSFGIAEKVSSSLDIGIEISKKLQFSFFDILFKK